MLRFILFFIRSVFQFSWGDPQEEIQSVKLIIRFNMEMSIVGCNIKGTCENPNGGNGNKTNCFKFSVDFPIQVGVADAEILFGSNQDTTVFAIRAILSGTGSVLTFQSSNFRVMTSGYKQVSETKSGEWKLKNLSSFNHCWRLMIL